MKTIGQLSPAQLGRWSLRAGLVVLGLAALLMLFMTLRPVRAEVETPAIGDRSRPAAAPVRRDLAPLLAKMAGVRLIRPAQVQAAVLDSGAAKQLLKKLKLQGVVSMGGEPVAYVQVEGGGTQAVRKGGAVLEFVVEKIEAGRVSLSLQGVVVELTH